ncbi:putative SOS response-associated peptidase YedK [Sphingomonas zeicaulis]
MADWALSYRLITVAANPDVAPHQHRHGAVILRRQLMQWLDATIPDAELLAPPPRGTFRIDVVDDQAELSLLL